MNTPRNTHLITAIAMIGLTALGLGSTASLSQWGMAQLDPQSGSGDVITGSGETLIEESIPEDLPFGSNIDKYLEENYGLLLGSGGTITSTGSGGVLALLQDLYNSSAIGITSSLFPIEAPQGVWQDLQDSLTEYVLSEAIAEEYRAVLLNTAAHRSSFETTVIDYHALTDDNREASYVVKEDPEHLSTRAANHTVVHMTTGSGSLIELEGNNFELAPYTNVAEGDVLHVGLRALGEIRALLDLPRETVAFYLTTESAIADTNAMSLAPIFYGKADNGWNIVYQLYYKGKKVQGATLMLRVSVDGELTYVRSNFPALEHMETPPEKTVFYETITGRMQEFFSDFDSTKDIIEEMSDIYILKNGEIHPAIDVRVSMHKPFGLWHVLVDARDGSFVSRYNLYEFGEEIPHSTSLIYLPNSTNDAPAYTTQEGQYVTLSPSGEQLTADGEGIFYPKGETSLIGLAGPHIRVYNGSENTQSTITRNYLEYASDLLPASGTGATLLGALWDTYAAETEQAAGLAHPLYWTPDDASLAEMNIYAQVSKYNEYASTVLGVSTPTEQPIVANSELLDTALNGCGALYDPSTGVIHFGKGGCGEQSYSYSRDMIIHEYAHGLINRIYAPTYSEYTFDEALQEGSADYLAASFTNDPLVGEYTLFKPRLLDNTLAVVHYDEFGNILGSDWSQDTYTNSMLIGGVLWDIRKELGGITTDKLVLEALHYQPHNGEELRVALLHADDDDHNIFNGTPNEAIILNVFAKRGIVDHYNQSDIAGFAELGLSPLAPTNIHIYSPGVEGPYTNVRLGSGALLVATFNDNRSISEAAQIEVERSENKEFSTTERIFQGEIAPIENGDQNSPIQLTLPAEPGYIRVRFYDQDGHAGLWSTPLLAKITEFAPYELLGTNEALRYELMDAIDARAFVDNSKRLSVLTATGVTVLDGNTSQTLSIYALDGDMEAPLGHMSSSAYEIIYDKDYQNVLLLQKEGNERFLFSASDAFVKEFALWTTAPQIASLPEHIVDMDLHDHFLMVTSHDGFYRYDLSTKSSERLYLAQNETLMGSTISDEGRGFVAAKDTETGEMRIYAFSDITAEANMIQPAYYYCTPGCASPVSFQQLPAIAVEGLRGLSAETLQEDDDILVLTYNGISVLRDPYNTNYSGATHYQFGAAGTDPAVTYLPTVGQEVISSDVYGHYVAILLANEVVLLDSNTNEVVEYIPLEQDHGFTTVLMTGSGQIYLHSATDFRLYAKSAPLHNAPTDTTGVGTPTPSDLGTEVIEPETPTSEETDEETITEPEVPAVNPEQVEATLTQSIALSVVVNSGGAELHWQDIPSPAVKNYHIYRANNDTVSSTSVRIAELTPETNSHTDTLISESGVYRYIVYAVDELGSIMYKSNVVEVQTTTVPPQPTFVLPTQGSVVFHRPVLQFESTFAATTDAFYNVQFARDSNFENVILDYLSGDVTTDQYSFKLGQAAGNGTYVKGGDITSLTPGVYFARGRLVRGSDIQGAWSPARQMIVDELNVEVNSFQNISFETAARGESIISSGATIIRAETYVPSFSFKIYSDGPLRLNSNPANQIKSWDGEEGFGFAFRWSADGGQSWNYRKGDSEVEWTRIPENLSYYPLGRKESPTLISLHSDMNTTEKKEFMVELMFRVSSESGEIGHYSTNIMIAPSKDMYGLFNQ